MNSNKERFASRELKNIYKNKINKKLLLKMIKAFMLIFKKLNKRFQQLNKLYKENQY